MLAKQYKKAVTSKSVRTHVLGDSSLSCFNTTRDCTITS